jgi:hydroxyacylglutathione hydrolase
MPDFKLAILPVTQFEQNCSLLWEEDTQRAMVVDPGGDADEIFANIEKLGLKVELILLTHGHLDHVGGAMALKEMLGGAVPIHGPDIRDKFLMDEAASSAERMGMTGMANCTPDRWLEEGDTVDLGMFHFDIYHCPGHSPGSLVYVDKNLRFAFVGDVLFCRSVGRSDFEYGDAAALVRSIRRKLLPLGDDIGFICGHGPASSFGEERKQNPFLQFAP